MKLLLAALAVTFAIAVTASVFAIWPAVADAPWEDEFVMPTPVIQKAPTPDRCLVLLDAIGRSSRHSYLMLRTEYGEAGC